MGHHAELCGEHDLVAAAPPGAADQLLVGVWGVDLGGVDEGDAKMEGTVNGPDSLASSLSAPVYAADIPMAPSPTRDTSRSRSLMCFMSPSVPLLGVAWLGLHVPK